MKRIALIATACLVLLGGAPASAGSCRPIDPNGVGRGSVEWVKRHPDGPLASKIVFLARQGQQWTGEWYCAGGYWWPFTHPAGSEPPVWG